MYILSQDRTKIINANTIAMIDRFKAEIYATQTVKSQTADYIPIAEYGSEYEAQEVLENIHQAMACGYKAFKLPKKGEKK